MSLHLLILAGIELNPGPDQTPGAEAQKRKSTYKHASGAAKANKRKKTELVIAANDPRQRKLFDFSSASQPQHQTDRKIVAGQNESELELDRSMHFDFDSGIGKDNCIKQLISIV